MNSKRQHQLLELLKTRFEKNRTRHEELKWDVILSKIEINPKILEVLYQMENTGGEPDVIYDQTIFDSAGKYLFFDCSVESPKGRRNLCYDRQALEARKRNKPENSAADLAAEIGIKILTEEQYRILQQFGEFDTKTSSWVKTPDRIRKLGGAIFCDRRYDTVFVYHNSAESYYSARGFRGLLEV